MKKDIRVTSLPPPKKNANSIQNQYLYSNSTKPNISWAAQNCSPISSKYHFNGTGRRKWRKLTKIKICKSNSRVKLILSWVHLFVSAHICLLDIPTLDKYIDGDVLDDASSITNKCGLQTGLSWTVSLLLQLKFFMHIFIF